MDCHVHNIDRAEVANHDNFSAVRIRVKSPDRSTVTLFLKPGRADALAAAINAAVAESEVQS